MYDFFRFPSTPHLAWLSETEPREDKVMSQQDVDLFLKESITIEEKIDGANVGISWSSTNDLQAQNRGSYLLNGGQNHPQFNALWPWIFERQHLLEKHLPKQCIVFGEWSALKHSQHYLNLPDWYIGFDVYDKREMLFYSAERRNTLLNRLKIQPIKRLDIGYNSLESLTKTLSTLPSTYGNPHIEGLYLRIDKGGWLEKRAKIVRKEFVQSIDSHWKKQPLVNNNKAI